MPNGDYLLSQQFLLALPSVFALATKFVLYWWSRGSLKEMDRYLLLFLVSLSALNFCELSLFTFVANPGRALLPLKLYYACAVLAAVAFVGMGVGLYSGVQLKPVAIMLATVFLCLVCLIFMPEMSIVGAKSIGYSVTRVAGEYFWLLRLALLVLICTAIAFLVAAISYSDTLLMRKQAVLMLIASAPLFLSVIIILGLMFIGVEVNATVITPIAINIMLAIFLLNQQHHKLFRFLSYVPLTQEYRRSRSVGSLVTGERLVGLADARDAVERQVILQALGYCAGNKTQAAERLSVSRQTLIRKIKLLGI